MKMLLKIFDQFYNFIHPKLAYASRGGLPLKIKMQALDQRIRVRLLKPLSKNHLQVNQAYQNTELCNKGEILDLPAWLAIGIIKNKQGELAGLPRFYTGRFRENLRANQREASLPGSFYELGSIISMVGYIQSSF